MLGDASPLLRGGRVSMGTGRTGCCWSWCRLDFGVTIPGRAQCPFCASPGLSYGRGCSARRPTLCSPSSACLRGTFVVSEARRWRGKSPNGRWRKLSAGIWVRCIPSWCGVLALSNVPCTPCVCESTFVHVCACTPGQGPGCFPRR